MRINLTVEDLFQEGLKNAENAGISHDSLSCFRTIVGPNYRGGGILFLGRATNGWDENKPKTLTQLIELNNSQLIRVIRNVSRHIYGEHGEHSVAYTQVCRIADCDSGNPSATLYKVTKEQNDLHFSLDMQQLKPSVVIAMVGDSVAENGWQASVWDSWLNRFPGCCHEVRKITICEREDKKYTMTLWQLMVGGRTTWFIFADRPESIKLPIYTHAINSLLDDIEKHG